MNNEMKKIQNNFLEDLAEIVPLTDLVPICTNTNRAGNITADEHKAMTIYTRVSSFSTLTNFTERLKRHGVVGDVDQDKETESGHWGQLSPSVSQTPVTFFTHNDYFIIKFANGQNVTAPVNSTVVRGINAYGITSGGTWKYIVQQCLGVDSVDLKKAFSHPSFGLSKAEVILNRDMDSTPYIAIPLDVIKAKLTPILTHEGLTTNSGSSLENYLGC